MDGRCPLCNWPWDDHTVHVEPTLLGGRHGVTHTGWDCPKKRASPTTHPK